MKNLFRKIFWFILAPFEKGDEPYKYKPTNRVILIVVGLLFIFLSTIVLYTSDYVDGYGYLIPVIIFFSVGFVSTIVGLLGSERAVAKIWGTR
jgi:hypothetical protein